MESLAGEHWVTGFLGPEPRGLARHHILAIFAEEALGEEDLSIVHYGSRTGPQP